MQRGSQILAYSCGQGNQAAPDEFITRLAEAVVSLDLHPHVRGTWQLTGKLCADVFKVYAVVLNQYTCACASGSVANVHTAVTVSRQPGERYS